MTWNIQDKICSIQNLKYWTSIRNIDIEKEKKTDIKNIKYDRLIININNL